MPCLQSLCMVTGRLLRPDYREWWHSPLHYHQWVCCICFKIQICK